MNLSTALDVSALIVSLGLAAAAAFDGNAIAALGWFSAAMGLARLLLRVGDRTQASPNSMGA